MKQKVQYPDFTEQLKAYKKRYNKTLMACLDSVFQKHLINPYQCMPNTEAALGAMLGVVLRK